MTGELTRAVLTVAQRLPEGWSVEILRMPNGPTLTLRAEDGGRVYSKAIVLLSAALDMAVIDLVEASWEAAERQLRKAMEE